MTAIAESPAWTSLAPDVDAFFAEYARRGADPDSNSGAHFAEQFLALDPNRALMLARTALVASLPARRQMFDKAGIGPLRLAGARQLDLDEHHVLVRADWSAERTGGQPLRLSSTFLVRRDEDGLRILVYLNHHDVRAALSRTTG